MQQKAGAALGGCSLLVLFFLLSLRPQLALFRPVAEIPRAPSQAPSSEPSGPWQELVAQQLQPFATSGITRPAVDRAGSLRFSWRVLISNNTLFVDDRHAGLGWDPILRGRPTLLMFQKLLCHEAVPDVEFVLSVVDQPRARRSVEPLPVLGWSTSSEHW